MGNITVDEAKKVVSILGPNDVTVDWHGNELRIKTTLSAGEMVEFVRNVVTGSFSEDDASYMPELTDLLMMHEIVDKYTNVDLPTDAEELYDLLYRTDLCDVVIDNVNGRQFTKMYNAINTKIKYMAETNVERVSAQMKDAAKQVTELAGNMASIMDGMTKEDVESLIAAVSSLGQIDEAKIVEAVIASQATDTK